MQVSVLYFAGCPNWREAGRRVREALDRTGHADAAVRFVVVRTAAEAGAVGLRGSPSVVVDGVDLFPVGVPDLADLVAALQDRGGW